MMLFVSVKDENLLHDGMYLVSTRYGLIEGEWDKYNKSFWCFYNDTGFDVVGKAFRLATIEEEKALLKYDE